MCGILRYTLVWGARYTLGAGYLSKNTVILFFYISTFQQAQQFTIEL